MCEEEHEIDDRDPYDLLKYKIVESAYAFKSDIFTLKGGQRKLTPDDMEYNMFRMMTYVLEFMTIIGANELDVYDFLTAAYLQVAHAYQDELVYGKFVNLIRKGTIHAKNEVKHEEREESRKNTNDFA